MGSHSVTCHPTQVNVPCLAPARKAGTRFTYPGGMEGWVDLGGWLHTDMFYLPHKYHRRSPIQVLTGPDADQLRWSRHTMLLLSQATRCAAWGKMWSFWPTLRHIFMWFSCVG